MTIQASKVRGLLALLLAVGLAACGEKGMTYGDANSVIAVTDAERWSEIQDDVFGAIERTIQTVRDEKTFTVTYQEPYADFWNNLRRFRQMLLVGTLDDPWMVEALEETSSEIDIEGPGVYQVRNVWSRDQTATLIVLPDDGSLDGVPAMLEEVHATLDRQFRAYASNRMYFSGVARALADTLAAEAGFRLIVPEVYRWQRSDSVLVFRNDQPDPSELIRQVTVTWMTPSPGQLSVDEIIAWRQRVADAHYNEPQELVTEGMIVADTTFDGRDGMLIQTQWRNPPDRGWPAGGPVIVRTVTCDEQDRTYLLDAWLYAPGREKYEYMIQLETIMDTFDCGV
jgi:predicted small lipoprotein YifL